MEGHRSLTNKSLNLTQTIGFIEKKMTSNQTKEGKILFFGFKKFISSGAGLVEKYRNCLKIKEIAGPVPYKSYK